MPRTIVFPLTLAFLGLAAAQAPSRQEGRRQAAEETREPAGRRTEDAKDAAKPQTPPKDRIVITQHSIQAGGQELKYTANTGTIVLTREDGTPRASMFFVAYTKDDAPDPSKRPLTFAFNGGPGSSSVWLHLGALGPKRVLMDEDGNPLPPPYRLVDNEDTILDRTDLVFIDPVTTGFSRAAVEREAREFHGFQEDIAAVGEFIRVYTTRYERWASPKYLAGESYGTTRAAGLSGHLQQRLGMNLNGVILISAVLNFQTVRFDTGNDLPYILFLPTYAATAWYHKKLSKDLQADLSKTLAEVERFAAGEYAKALMRGSRLTQAERSEIAKKVARYTGLTPSYVEGNELRIEIRRFCKELLRDQRRTVGRYDSRFQGIDRDSGGEGSEYDPSYAIVQGPYTAMFNHYVRHDLKFTSDLPYEILSGRVRPWNWAPYENRYVNVAETLRGAMTQNRSLRLFVAKGIYDLATPYFAADYTVDHLGLDLALRSHVTVENYGAGHMFYVHRASLKKLKRDLAQFIQ